MIVNDSKRFVVCLCMRSDMQGTSVSKFRTIREELDATREDVLRHAPCAISLSSIRNAELGKRVSQRTAKQLFTAINILLQGAGRSPVNFDDLGLVVS